MFDNDVYPTPYSPITFIDCTFTDLTDKTEDPQFVGGGALHLLTFSPLLVKGCTFTNCATTRGSGRATFVQFDWDCQPHKLRIESSVFKDCSSLSGDGGGISVIPDVTRPHLVHFRELLRVEWKWRSKAENDRDYTEQYSAALFPIFGVSISDAHWEAQSDEFRCWVKFSDDIAVFDAKQARAELMRKTLPWLVPLIVCVVAAVIVVVLVVLCRRRHSAQKEPQAKEMNAEMFAVEDEKMEENEGTHDGLRNQHILTTAGNAVEVGKDTAKAEVAPESLPSALNVVEALQCEGKIEMTVVREVDTLYNALHVREHKRSIVKRVVERQIASGLAKIGEQTRTAAILTKLSSHWVMFDARGNVCLKLQEPTPSIPLPQPHTPQASQASQSGSGDKSNTQENQRWKAPEIVKGEEEKESKQEVNPLKASVFSLGLVLWEIETGSVPFAELDAVNAQRQMGTGTLPKMSGIGSEMRELIEQRLCLNPNDRPALSSVSSVLNSIAEEEQPPDELKASNN
ncbi:hypothetical protein BLNAU_22731 [Blattamonas nauphoetae]|uniref:Protein kinase domain-containing protein n=1 Tax=Blattamonas nauphoetae TaxID=2049346 RepID=A0ABQ9WS59_9EUKA|nr:hypothetical protein BLNAU_22731 [Blattamonas nauphoetae]